MTGTRSIPPLDQDPHIRNDYGPDGMFSALVAAIIQQCSCEREHAIAALKVYRNNVDHAVESIEKSRSRRRTTRRDARLDHEEKVVETSASEISHSNLVQQSRAPRTPRRVMPTEESDSAITEQVEEARMQPDLEKTSPAGLQVVTWESITSEKPAFQLPNITVSDSAPPFDPREGRHPYPAIERLLWAVQGGLSGADAAQYLSLIQPSKLPSFLDQPFGTAPSFFYIVNTGDEDLIRTWIKFGANVNVRESRYGVPLLAYAIFNASTTCGPESRMSIVSTLLGQGAEVSSIPPSLYNSGSGSMKPSPTEHRSNDSETNWCNPYFQQKMSSAMTISLKYILKRRAETQPPSSRLIQVASEHELFPLFSLPFTMIGQDLALQMLIGRLLTHLITPSDKPLVLTFAGPSGHGKTEVARRLGKLLSLNMLAIDMTQMKVETDLLGPHPPYHGYERGAPLNNFLAENSGKRAIVVLDEIEKAGPKLLDALLIVFDEGRYQDRRSRMQVKCTEIIWILATNALDSDIIEFNDSNRAARTDTEHLNLKLKESLSRRLNARMKSVFGAPLSGRVSAIIPFLPFTRDEQMVMAHKYLLDLQTRMFQPISPAEKRLVGQMHLQIANEVAVCRKLADVYYDPDRGARSLESAVKNEVEPKVVGKYLENSAQIVAGQAMEDYILDVDNDGHFE
ncbi:P-loop containing nucleoside triphosphate hydrolase protein, partial [Lophiostoma macrostomum CBS 122681]